MTEQNPIFPFTFPTTSPIFNAFITQTKTEKEGDKPMLAEIATLLLSMLSTKAPYPPVLWALLGLLAWIEAYGASLHDLAKVVRETADAPRWHRFFEMARINPALERVRVSIHGVGVSWGVVMAMCEALAQKEMWRTPFLGTARIDVHNGVNATLVQVFPLVEGSLYEAVMGVNKRVQEAVNSRREAMVAAAPYEGPSAEDPELAARSKEAELKAAEVITASAKEIEELARVLREQLETFERW